MKIKINIFFFIFMLFNYFLKNIYGDWGLGIGDWGLGNFSLEPPYRSYLPYIFALRAYSHK